MEAAAVGSYFPFKSWEESHSRKWRLLCVRKEKKWETDSMAE